MIAKLTKATIPIVLMMMYVQCINAQSKPNPITTAVPFLKVSPDARSGSMGDIGVATAPDVNSIFLNVAKTPFNEASSSIGVTYTPWLRELDLKSLYLLSASSYFKLNDKEAISFGLRYLSMGSLVFTDNVGNEIKSFKPSDVAYEAGYSRKLSDKLGIGLSVRYIHSKLADNSTNTDYKSGSAVAADLAAYYVLKNGWSFGAAFTNLGSKIGYSSTDNTKSYIPANLNIGAVYTKHIDNDNKISFGLDLNKLLVPTPPDPTNADKVANYNNKAVIGSWFSSYADAPGGFKEELQEVTVGLGTEYTYRKEFALRAGYFSESKNKGDRQYLTAGAGGSFQGVTLNFSYLVPTGSNTSTSALKNTLRMSLLFDFNK
ncbi:MAG: type IX secretion system outer membrane channel protein PorV [Ferruginibacter sp.]